MTPPASSRRDLTPPRRRLTIATRGSPLALWQANFLASMLHRRGVESEKLIVRTTADRVQDRFLHEIGGKGLFVKELEEALLAGKADVAIHSLKDMPAKVGSEFALAAVLARHAATDVLIFRSDINAQLKPKPLIAATDLWGLGALTVGTGSLRRQALLTRTAPALACVGIRGNVDTRLRKLDEGAWDAIILAEASLDRLGLSQVHRSRLNPDWFIPAPGQGALALETRAGDPLAAWLGSTLGCPDTTLAVTIERTILARLGGDCTLPFGCYVRAQSGLIPALKAHAAVYSTSGSVAEVNHSEAYDGAGRLRCSVLYRRAGGEADGGGRGKGTCRAGVDSTS